MGGKFERGREVTRIEAFVDAAFAFAVTLLVISFNALPDSVGALVEALKGVPAFAASFSLLAMLWWQHADWSRRYGLDDGRSVLLSLLLVFLVLVYVFPLRIIFTAFFGWVTNGWLPLGVTIRGARDLQLLFLSYAIAWTTLSVRRSAVSGFASPRAASNSWTSSASSFCTPLSDIARTSRA